MMTKKCNLCKIIKSVDDFNTKPGRNGQRRYNHICKTCQSQKIKDKNKEIKQSIKIPICEKICNNCKCTKQINCFTIDAYQLSGFSKMCKDCQAKYYDKNRERILASNIKSQRKYKLQSNLRKMTWAIKNKIKVRKASHLYYLKNIDKISEYNKKWAEENALAIKDKSHRYRVKKRNNTIQKFTIKQLEQRMSVFGFKCAYCGGSFDHIDHVKPISKGGYHCLSNLRPSCKKCNEEKSSKPLTEWLAEKSL